MRHKLFALAITAVLAIAGATAVNAAFDNPNKITVQDASGKEIETFSIEQLKAEFSQQTYNTRTPWTQKDKKIVYRGPLLTDVLAKSGLAETPAIKVVAYDNFVSEIRMDEIRSYKPILAVERQCTQDDRVHGRCEADQEFRPISMVEKGPIFIVWPYDRLPDTYVPARNAIWVFFPVVLRAEK
ncbi:MAG: hypothetical protein J0I98_19050 [Mesorhizobium sp.]|nr:hypothetical protein [Mesorhizobium sp.]MBN9244887.1 hypothetical protein [Mesorhizobium sp.]